MRLLLFILKSCCRHGKKKQNSLNLRNCWKGLNIPAQDWVGTCATEPPAGCSVPSPVHRVVILLFLLSVLANSRAAPWSSLAVLPPLGLAASSTGEFWRSLSLSLQQIALLASYLQWGFSPGIHSKEDRTVYFSGSVWFPSIVFSGCLEPWFNLGCIFQVLWEQKS